MWRLESEHSKSTGDARNRIENHIGTKLGNLIVAGALPGPSWQAWRVLLRRRTWFIRQARRPLRFFNPHVRGTRDWNRAGRDFRESRGIALERPFFDCIDAITIKSEIAPDGGHRRVWILIGPNGIDRAFATEWYIEIGAITLIGAIGRVIRPLQLGHIDVLALDVLNGRIRCLGQRQRILRVGDDAPCVRDHDPVGIAFDRDRMLGSRYLDRLCGLLAHIFTFDVYTWESTRASPGVRIE
jgi:hypothetical protein